MKKSVKVIISLVAVLGVLYSAAQAVGVYYMINFSKAMMAIEQEFTAMDKYLDEDGVITDFEGIYNILDRRVVSQKEFAPIEDCTKEYYRDIYEHLDMFYKCEEDEFYLNILSLENYDKDGPNFKESKAVIDESRQTLTELRDFFSTIAEPETIEKYWQDKGLNQFQAAFFELEAEMYTPETAEATVESIDYSLEYVDVCEETINYLISINGKWEVDDDYIYFDTQKLVDDYDAILEKLD